MNESSDGNPQTDAFMTQTSPGLWHARRPQTNSSRQGITLPTLVRIVFAIPRLLADLAASSCPGQLGARALPQDGGKPCCHAVIDAATRRRVHKLNPALRRKVLMYGPTFGVHVVHVFWTAGDLCDLCCQAVSCQGVFFLRPFKGPGKLVVGLSVICDL